MPTALEHWGKLRGRIEVTAGPMFAGKSDAIITFADRWKRAGAKVYVAKHPLDTRYKGVGEISSHSGKSIKCEAYADPVEIYRRVQELDPLVVIIDEVQFYIESKEVFIEMVRQLANEGRIVMLAGLNMDFRGEPFGPMPILMSIAEKVHKLTAICQECGAEATHTQRLIDGQPAPYDSELVVVGAEQAYQARCRNCHVVPGRRGFKDMLSGIV